MIPGTDKCCRKEYKDVTQTTYVRQEIKPSVNGPINFFLVKVTLKCDAQPYVVILLVRKSCLLLNSKKVCLGFESKCTKFNGQVVLELCFSYTDLIGS